MCMQAGVVKKADLDVLEDDVGSKGAAGLRGGDLGGGHIHALEVVPGGAVGFHSLGQRRQEVAHVHTPKGVPAAYRHSEQIYLPQETRG